MMKSAPAQFHRYFLLFHCVERFLQTFPNTFQALRSVEFKFFTQGLVFEHLCDLWTNENSFFHLDLTYFGRNLP